tara:strand:+ start:3250 stop:3564 length:315 start_codon:yes stop_codon:yes gene_type:complete
MTNIFECNICLTNKRKRINNYWTCGKCQNTQCAECIAPLIKSYDSLLKVKCPCCRSKVVFVDIVKGNRIYSKNIKVLHAMLDAIYDEIDQESEEEDVRELIISQ